MLEEVVKVVDNSHTKNQNKEGKKDKGLTRKKKASMKKVTPEKRQIKNELRREK